MSHAPLTLRPGINVEATGHALQTGYSSSAFCRFRSGFFEKMGGWKKYFPFNLGFIPRALQAFLDINQNTYLALGTTGSLDILNAGILTHVTPQQLTTNFAPNFTTTTGPNANTVTITDTNINNITTFDAIEFRTPISVGGIILSGIYQISGVTGAQTYTIFSPTAATSAVSNGGAVPLFTTTNGSATVQVTLNNHGLVVGKFIVFPIPTTVGGITIQGNSAAISIIDANNFNIAGNASATASTSGSMNGGNCQLLYYITIGPAAAPGTSYGFGTYSQGPYSGLGATGGAPQGGTAIAAADWTLDNWDQTLLSCPANGGIYQYTPGAGNQQAQLISTGPLYNSGIFIGQPYKALFAYGSTIQRSIGLVQDPGTYRVSDLNDFTNWAGGIVNPNTGVTSQALQSRIPSGTGIKAGLATPNQVLLWTDLDLWSIVYANLPTIWNQNKIGTNCGTVGRHAIGQMAGVVYWWGIANFWALAGGAPVVIPCSIWDVVFQDIDPNNRQKCWVQTVTAFNEVWYFWVSLSGAGTNGGEVDSYAKVNVLDGAWDFGRLPRSIGIDNSVLGGPIMCSPTGIIYSHESGYDADGSPLVTSFQSGFFYLGEAQDFETVDAFFPDFHFTTFSSSTPNANVQVSFLLKNFPSDTPTVKGPFTMSVTTKKLDIRFRCREVAIVMTSTDVGSWWRIGKPYFRIAPSGRR